MSETSHIPRSSQGVLTLGAIGVVYGDIGTSPLYAFREALSHVAGAAVGRDDIIGVLSLALWALIVVVTLKYVFFLTRMDNDGEGGVLSLMALAQRFMFQHRVPDGGAVDGPYALSELDEALACSRAMA